MDDGNSDSNFNKTNPIADTLRAEELLKDREAIKRALDYYLDPPTPYAEKNAAPAPCSWSPRIWIPKASWPTPTNR